MTQRQLDLALLAGIGVLLVVILILALSGAPTTAGDISDPVDRVTALESAEEGAAAEPASEPTPAVTTGDAAESAAADTAGTSEEGAPTVTAVGEVVAGGETSQAAGAEAPDPAPPAGGVRLERIGFAYATGSEGACGVPLTAWGHVALSRDLLDDFPCGTAVTLTLDDEIAGRQSVTAQVGDTMGAGVTGTVNIFVGQDEPALEYGVTGGTLSP